MENEFLYVSNTFVPYNYPLEEAEIIFVGIPFSSTSVSDSSQYGPTIIRESLKLIEGFDAKSGKDLLGKKICDLGNIEIVPGSYELTAERVKDTINQIREINKNAVIIFLGGEHLITLPVVDALKPKTIVHLDAHKDLRKDFLGNTYSHTTWAYHAKKSIDCDIIQIGTREFCQEEQEIEKELGINSGIENLKNIKGPVYLTVDIDVFEPCYVETGLPSSNGLTPKQVFEIIEMLKGNDIIGMDINEVSSRELPSKTGFLAAEVIKKFIGIL